MVQLANFIQKRGLAALLLFVHALNSGQPASSIARRLKVSEARVIQWKKLFFECRYVFTDDALAYLEHERHWQQYLVEQRLQGLQEEMHHDQQFRLRLLIPRERSLESFTQAPRQSLCRTASGGMPERRELLADQRTIRSVQGLRDGPQDVEAG